MTMPVLNPASIWTDPSYLAYRAALGLESDTAVSRVRASQDAARRQAALGVYDIQQSGELARRNIGGNFESRGLSFSSDRQRAMADQRGAEGRRVAGVQEGLGSNLGDLEWQVAQMRASQGRQGAEAAYNAAPKAQATAQGY